MSDEKSQVVELIKASIEEQQKAIYEMRKANDECLKAKADNKAVSDLEAKVDKANEEIGEKQKLIDALTKKYDKMEQDFKDEVKELLSKQRQGEVDDDKFMIKESKRAMQAFLSKGEEGLGKLDIKAETVNVTVDADGRYAIPERLERTLLELVRDRSPMRQICGNIRIAGEDYRRPVNMHGANGGWVGEKDARPQTDAPKLAQITPIMGEVFANPAATQRSIDDMYFSAPDWIMSEIALTFSEYEGAAFLTGDGIEKPKGLMSYPIVAAPDATRPFGSMQFIPTGVASGFPAPTATVLPADVLIDTIHATKAAYRQRARWMMNTLTVAEVRKWKDNEGRYLWQPSIIVDQPATLLGFAVTENEDMPMIGANSIPIAYGDFSRCYTIVDRIGIRLLRDPYTNKPFVHFYTTKRVGSLLEDTQAVKFVKVTA